MAVGIRVKGTKERNIIRVVGTGTPKKRLRKRY